VLVGDVAETRTIRTGISNNVQVQVLEGLHEGEKVVVGDSTSLPKTESSAMPPHSGGKR
jgi:macrolide-specific efflux system membrane fusion protein